VNLLVVATWSYKYNRRGSEKLCTPDYMLVYLAMYLEGLIAAEVIINLSFSVHVVQLHLILDSGYGILQPVERTT